MDLSSLNVLIGANTTGLQQGLRQATATIQRFAAQGGADLQDFARRAGQAGTQAADALARGFSGANGKLAAGFADLDARQKVFEAGFGRLGGVFKSVGEDFSKFVTLPIVAGIGLSAKAAIDFESAFAGVKKTLNTTGLDAQQTEAEYARLSDGIRGMAREIPVAATELAKIAESAGQLGIQRGNVLGFTRTIADLGVSTNLAGEEAASTLAKFANISQLDQSQFGNLGSTIVALGNNFATTEADIAAMGLRIAGAGKQVGLTEAQVLGFSAALSSVGIEAEAGGTAFSTVLKKIQVATEQGGKSLDGFAKVSGQSSAQFKKNFQTDAAGAVVAFIEGLGKVKGAGGSTIQTLTALDLGNIRTSDSLLRLAGAGDLVARATSLAGKAFQENTALSKEAGQRYETTASQIQVAKNRLNDLGITIGNQLLPVIKGMAGLLGGASDALNSMSPAAARTALIVAGLVAAIGPLALAIGGILALVPTLAAGFTALGAAVTFATGPIGIAVVAIAALAAGIGFLANAQERSVESFQQAKSAANELNGTLAPLLARYDELTGKTKLTNAEQEELKRIVEQVAKAVPSAVTQVDAYGKATAISTTRTREFVAALKEVEKQKAIDVLPGAQQRLKEIEQGLASLKRKRDEFNRSGSLEIQIADSQDESGNVYTKKVGAGSTEVRAMQRDLANANLAYAQQKALVQELNQSINGLAVTAVTAGQKQKDAAETGQKAASDTGKAGQKAASDISKAFQDIQQKLQGLNTQVKLGITAEGVEATTQKVKILEDGIKRLTEVGVGAGNQALQALNTQLLTLQQTLDKGFTQVQAKVVTSVPVPQAQLPDQLATGPDKGQVYLNTMLALGDATRQARAESIAFGSSFDETGANISATTEAIQSLLENDFSPFSAQVQGLAADLNQLGDLQGLKAFNEQVESILVDGMTDIASGFAEAVGQMAVGAAGADQLPKVLLSSIGNMAIQLGQLAIGTAFAIEGIKAALKSLNPVVAFAAGVALVGLGAAVVGTAAKIGKSGGGAGGGSVGSYSPPNQSAASASRDKINLVVTFQPVELRAEGASLRSVMQVDNYRLTTTR